VAIRNALLALVVLLALTGPAAHAASEAQAFQAMVRQGLAAAPQDFASIRADTNHGNQYVPSYDTTLVLDAQYLTACSVMDETDPSSFEHPSWTFDCTIAMPGDSSDARLAQIVAEVAPAIPDGFVRTDRSSPEEPSALADGWCIGLGRTTHTL